MRTLTWKLNPSRRDPNKLVLIGPYDEDFVRDLKHTIPPRYRSYSDITRAWTIDKHVEKLVQDVIKRHNRTVLS